MYKKTSKNGSIKFKILVIPIIIMFTIISAITFGAVIITKSKLISQMKIDALNLSIEISKQIERNNSTMDALNEFLESKIQTLGEFIVNTEDSSNNDYLTSLAKTFQVDEICITDKTGKVTYSNLLSSIGYVFSNDNICYQVISGQKTIAMEPIRKSKKTSNYYKYGYIKKSDGGMVQIGILSNKIQKLTDSLNIQSVLDDAFKGENIIYALFIDKNLKTVAHTDKSRIGTVLNDIGSKTAAVDGKQYSSIYKYKNTIPVYDVLVPIRVDGVHIGAINIGLSMENVSSVIYNTISFIIIISIIAFIIAVFIMLKISGSIIKPLNNLVCISKDIAEGDLTSIIDINRSDEIGVLANSFKYMSKSLKKAIGSIKENTLVVNDMASNLKINSEQMTLATGEVTNAVQDVTKGTNQQANDLVEITSSMSSLVKELQNIHKKITKVKNTSTLIADKTVVGKEQIDILLKSISDVREVFELVFYKINNLNISVSQIGNITNVINTICEQTNLLALNAAIEAAIVGESGKGFAVVAEEIRKLAEQSKTSTEQIQTLIKDISNETNDVIRTSEQVNDMVINQSNVVNDTMTSFNDMLSFIEAIPLIVDKTYDSLEITMKSKDIVLNKIEAVTAVSEETSASSEEISASSEEMFASSESVAKFALDLNKAANKLNDETNKFKI
ncbi:methyl-accepting chemotaxis protein [Clostridium tetani]|uniref:Methyl-accepting chemotaxis protein n=2 Tax=Clostridium tetani TaxID=1513 RepID=A0ABC8ED63_CLOTA|nr:methyl-accepting chemotaxis protein [Clostridium tetani]BDR67651.1 methyl-accepting chemotaxis protein [Clostridium tetani]BDR81584.1 methyl-accepting chemotaxis protein [Clostridium tetani]BDR89966.1 methyl-accepting chemotaxis protein [Clostridium tetani]